ncbi:MAG: group II intron reverse transcriptase/maturase [Gammaproteobacteria bacterium]|nr:group II intron reverse transcriptase/maturase [Gammaproteobacteria bacterium]
MNLQSPGKVQKLQQALHAKAKGSPDFRFYVLYDKIYREDILAHAYRLARSNGGKPGVNREDFSDIEAYGVERWWGELAQALKEKRYRASPVRRVYIPKPNGKQRHAQDAVRHVHMLLNTGYTDVIDADLSGYFDSIPHAELMQCVGRRISDRHVLALIKQWLVVPVEEDDGRGGRRRTTKAKDTRRGIPHGAPISPLLSNLYMRRFVLGWKILGLEACLQARIVNFADDFVICCRGTGKVAMESMRAMMARLKLTVNEEKTQHCRIPQERFDFLGYTFGRCYSTQTGRAYIGTRPSKKSIKKVCRTISEATMRRMLQVDPEDQVKALNRILVGWANYFSLGPVSKAYRAVDSHATERLRRWLCKKHKRPGQGTARYPDEHLYDVLGLQRLSVRTRDLPWSKA